MVRIAKVVSGGQTGADRAALDAAIRHGLRYGGWCPLGGWAEDLPTPPGLLATYSALRETPSATSAMRTEWNVRDSDATLIVGASMAATSPGTDLTRRVSRALGRPCIDVDPDDDDAAAHGWLSTLEAELTINVAGPRESQAPGLYAACAAFMDRLLEVANRPERGR